MYSPPMMNASTIHLHEGLDCNGAILIKYLGKAPGKSKPRWKVRLQSGQECVVQSDVLKEKIKHGFGWKSNDGKGQMRHLQAVYKKGAKTRSLCWELSERQFDTLINGACHYCGIVGENSFTQKPKKTINYNGIDRKNNSDGYTTDNSVSCCGTCNYAKRGMPYQKFNSWLNRFKY